MWLNACITLSLLWYLLEFPDSSVEGSIGRVCGGLCLGFRGEEIERERGFSTTDLSYSGEMSEF